MNGASSWRWRAAFSAAIFCASFFAIAVPILASLYFAHRESYADERARAESLANETLRRADVTRAQMRMASAMMRSAGADVPPCSPEYRRRMAGVALRFDQLHGLGFIRGDDLVCTTIGQLPRPFDLGPTEYRTTQGYGTRRNVRLPFSPQTRLVMFDNGLGLALFVHPRPTIDIDIDDATEGVGIISLESRRLINGRGRVDLSLLRRYFRDGKTAYVAKERLIVVQRSVTGDYAGFAMLSTDQSTARYQRSLLLILPIGMACAALLIFLIRLVVKRESSLAAAIRRALRTDQFYLNYQPIVDMRTGRWVAAEALIRWRRVTGEEIRPDLFVSVMEEEGLIDQLTDRVFALLAAEIGPFLRNRPDFYISINVAPADLQGSRVRDLIDQLAQRTGCPPHQFAIEATERGLIDTDDGHRALEMVRERGVSVALDDFGTGYSSLSYLERFRIDTIKVDKFFVDAVGTGSATSSVIGHIINMAQDLGLQLVAEGVETAEQEAFLLERGVVYAQGWRFARAMSLSRLIEQTAPA